MDSIPHDMRRFWYPISLSRDLKEKDVIALHILGDPIVLYRDPAGHAVCLSDRCAHRSAPLSIGRIMDGVLECRYHGWQYDREGKCVLIPSLLPDRKIPANANVYRYPLKEVDELIWIWPGPQAEADIGKIPRIQPGSEDDSCKWGAVFSMAADLDIDHSLMVENLLDPAHLPFTHENTLSKRSNARPLEMLTEIVEMTAQVARKEGHKVFAMKGTLKDMSDKVKLNEFHFIAPCHIVLRAQFHNGWRFSQTMYCVPTRSGHMRLIYSQSKNFFTFTDGNSITDAINRSFATKIIFQDYELLHGQQARLKQGAKPWHCPIQVDGLPKLYREWLRKASSLSYSQEEQDDYKILHLGTGPWFAGWKPCGTDVMDIEDLNQKNPCKHDCSVPDSNNVGADIDDEWYVPCQAGVDNSAYTWRRDKQLGRATKTGFKYDYWLVALAVGGISSLLLAAKQ